MRYVVLDTETTGLSPADGHRIIEIAAIEVVNRSVTNNTYQAYINPKRLVEPEAYDVHGISDEFLSDKPVFEEIVEEFMSFVSGSEVIIHNAPFDVGFLDMELARLKRPAFGEGVNGIIDTLTMARRLHPGKRNRLDDLCDRYAIDKTARTLHGALIDTQLLAEVYLAMTRGQNSLLDTESTKKASALSEVAGSSHSLSVPITLADEDELSVHKQYIESLESIEGVKSIWSKVD